MQTMIEQADLASENPSPRSRHRCEVLPLSGNVQDDCQRLCKLLDEADTGGSDCLAVLPVQYQIGNLRGGILSTEKQAAFTVVLRERAA